MTITRNLRQKVLVIAYGNPLRSDDGVAWQIAEQLKRVLPASAHVICVHQLTPELAEPASCADVVIFMDASAKGRPGSVLCRPLSTPPGELRFWHQLTPAEILAMSKRLYSADPRAFLISVSGKYFDHGDQYTPAVRNAIPRAVGLVESIVKSHAAVSVSS